MLCPFKFNNPEQYHDCECEYERCALYIPLRKDDTGRVLEGVCAIRRLVIKP